ncbi:MAG TPA: glycine/sarcosine/betaine reductase component B subunit [Bacillota bacterium]|nr:glycine/sarcosine/betaine reductase component B subunit [Bacillota bacterium]
MRLELGRIRITDVQFGDQTRVTGGTLFINQGELKDLLEEDPDIARVELDLAKPGEDVRIIPVKDVIEPRVKVQGPGGVFPGFISKVDTVGSGRTHVLDGVAVVTTGKIVGFQEGIIDMGGPGAAYSPFSQTLNVVVKITPVEGLPQHKHEQAVRLAGLKAAAYLGNAGRELEPDQLEVYELGSYLENAAAFPGLPKVVYLYMLQSQGLLHDTYVYGVDAKKILPSLISPTEIMDGAIVSGNCVSACDKNTTYHHQNNPVIAQLFQRHGRDLCFLGVVITNENVTLADKERSSSYAAKLVKMIGAEGAIITEEGFGNPDTDLMMNCRKLEELGVKTVLITDEYAGRDGASQSLADAVPQANAVVSAGNANEMITLPPCGKVIGDLEAAEVIAGGFAGALAPDGSLRVEIQAITGSTCELGFSKLRGDGF